MRFVTSSFIAAVLAASPLLAADPAPDLQQAFQHPPDDARPLVRWWWFGPAVTQPQILRELQAMKSGGFGGFELQTTYPLATGENPSGVGNFKFESNEHLSDIHYAAEQAKSLGLRMDLTLGSGWPYGGATTPIEMAAGRLRVIAAPPTPASGPAIVHMPMLREGEQLLAMEDGSAFISSRTRMQVKRPAWGAEGFVLDHLDPNAVKHFLDTIATPALDACGSEIPHALFCDSLESYGEDWTPNFLTEFQRRRGYDLKPLLPALVGESNQQSLEIRHDWGQTLTELFNDNFAKQLTAYAHAHNTLFRIQAYGTPSAAESSYMDVDLPEGEGFQWHNFRETRYASSATHLLGVPVSSSETFTWIHPPVFRATPLDIKAEANLHFLQGVNQIICHGWPYSPPQAADPGWSFYASGVFNDHNPWWPVMPEVTGYLTRCSAMLRQGHPANDVLLYLPNDDAWAHFTLGHVSATQEFGELLGPHIVGNILDAGFNLDFVDDQLLAARGKIDGDSLAFGDLHYRAIILPGVERIPPATLATLEQFAKSGGIVIATRRWPTIAPGHLATAADRQAVHAAAARLFQGDHPEGIFVGDESKIGEALASRLTPDIAFSPASPQIGFVHRDIPNGAVYFLANTSNQFVNAAVSFRDARAIAQQWDPVTGQTQSLATNRSMPLLLAPYQSTFIIFTGGAAPPAPLPTTTIVERVPAKSIDLSTDWTVQFGNRPPTPMPTLKSWTDDSATRNFSGTAIYTRTMNDPRANLSPGQHLILNLGLPKPQPPQENQRPGSGYFAAIDPPVAEAAIVYVNNQRAGAVWCPPYSLDITPFLKPGDNQLRIEVSNTAVNELANGKFPNYDYRGLLKEFGNRFQPAKADQFEPVPSGLFGPITLSTQP